MSEKQPAWDEQLPKWLAELIYTLGAYELLNTLLNPPQQSEIVDTHKSVNTTNTHWILLEGITEQRALENSKLQLKSGNDIIPSTR